MAINFDIWGAAETWRNDTYLNNADILIPATDRDTFRENYQAERIEYNTIDFSIAFWGISKNAYFAQPKYIACYTDNGVTGTVVEKVHEPVDMPLMLTTSDMAGYTAPKNYENRYMPDVTSISGSYNYTSYMTMSFNYQKVMIIPAVVYINPTNDSIGEATFEYYINNDMSQGYNRIIGIGYRMYRGIPEVNVQRSSNLLYGLAPVFSHDVDNYDLHYNDKIFYARGGYTQLLRGVTSSSGNVTYLTPIMSEINAVQKNNTVDVTTAMAYKYCVDENSNPDERWYFFDDDPLWQVNGDNYSGRYWRPYPYIECTSATLNTVKAYIFKQLAYLGFPFCLTVNEALNKKIGDAGVYLPVFDENGITTGEYVEGADALQLPNAEWIDARSGSGYDPYRPDPAGDLDNVTGRNLNFWSSNKYYLMRQEDLDEFLARVNGLYTGGSTAEEKAEELRRLQVDFKGSNPSDYIVGLYGIPFQWVWSKEFFQPVMLGPVEVLPNDSGSSTAVELVNPDSDAQMLFGEIQIPELGNFLDYEPYTTLMLYVPFCGTCKLDTAEYIGHSVRVVGTLDKQTGELAVRIMRDGLTVTNTMTGNLYVSIPITAQAMGTYETNLHQLQMAAFNREFGLLTGAVTGGVSMGAAAAGGEGEGGGGGMISPTAPISMAANLIQLPIAMADYDFRITHCQPPVFYSSSASSANQAKFYRKAKLFIKRPVFLDTYTTDIGKYVYAHTVGYACCIQLEHINDMATADHDHLIKCSNVCLTGIPATVEEINAIKQALCSGVYI